LFKFIAKNTESVVAMFDSDKYEKDRKEKWLHSCHLRADVAKNQTF